MRHDLLKSLTFAATMAAGSACSAATYSPALVTLAIGGVASEAVAVDVDEDGRFRDSLDFALCDGSVRPGAGQLCDGSVVPSETASLSLSGSVFPFIDAALSFSDGGTPTSIVMTIILPIVAILGPAAASLEGSVTLPNDRLTPGIVWPAPGDSHFLTGSTGPGIPSLTSVLATGTGPVVQPAAAPEVTSFGPVSTSFDCTPLGGCTFIQLELSMTGLGDGQTSLITGRFDVDAAPAAVPLPAASFLLAGAFAAVCVLRKSGVRRAARRRAG